MLNVTLYLPTRTSKCTIYLHTLSVKLTWTCHSYCNMLQRPYKWVKAHISLTDGDWKDENRADKRTVLTLAITQLTASATVFFTTDIKWIANKSCCEVDGDTGINTDTEDMVFRVLCHYCFFHGLFYLGGEKNTWFIL